MTRREMIARAASDRPGQCLHDPVLDQVSRVLALSVLGFTRWGSLWVHKLGSFWDETKPEDASQLLRGAQPAPESTTTAERALASGHQLCHSGVCPCCPTPAGGAKHWRHYPCGQPTSLAEPFLIHCSWGKRCTEKCVPERQHGRTGNRAQTVFA